MRRLARRACVSALAIALVACSPQPMRRRPAWPSRRRGRVDHDRRAQGRRRCVLRSRGARRTLLQIPADGPLPERVHGALTTGEFSWGTFVRALAAYADTRDTRIVGGRDVVPLIARVGVSESAKGSKAFAQLYAALALRHFGADLGSNALWQSLSGADRAGMERAARSDAVLRSEDPTRDRPAGELSRRRRPRRDALVPDGRARGSRVRRCAARSRGRSQFTAGALYADDARYDRAVRSLLERVCALRLRGRRDRQPTGHPRRRCSRRSTAQMQLWWDLVSPDGYGYHGAAAWASSATSTRSRSSRSSPRIRVCVRRRSPTWRASIASPGSGCVTTTTPAATCCRSSRPAAATTHTSQRTRVAADRRVLRQGADGAGHADAGARGRARRRASRTPRPPRVARFEFFRRGDRPAGVWLVRQGPLRFALPITTGTKPASPTTCPRLTACRVRRAGRTDRTGRRLVFRNARRPHVVAADSADEIVPARGRTIAASNLAALCRVGGKTGEWIEPGIRSHGRRGASRGRHSTRTETLTARRDVSDQAPVVAVVFDRDEPPRRRRRTAERPLIGPEGRLDVRAERAN